MNDTLPVEGTLDTGRYGRGLVVNGHTQMFKDFFPTLDVNVYTTGLKSFSKNIKGIGYDAVVYNMALSATPWDGIHKSAERMFSLLRDGSKFALVEPVFDWMYTQSPDVFEWADINAHLFGVGGNKSAWRVNDIRAIVEVFGLRVTSANVVRYEFTFNSGRTIKPFLGLVYGDKP